MQGANLSFYFLSKDSGGQWKSFFSSQGHSSENSTMFGDASAGFAQRTQSLLAVAKGASPVTENEFKLFKRAMGEQGQSKSSVADVIAAASKKGQVDAWGASGGMPVVGQQK